MRLCKDCKWCSDPKLSYAFCQRKGILSPVTGKHIFEIFCATERFSPWPICLFDKSCGRQGRFWEGIIQLN